MESIYVVIELKYYEVFADSSFETLEQAEERKKILEDANEKYNGDIFDDIFIQKVDFHKKEEK